MTQDELLEKIAIDIAAAGHDVRAAKNAARRLLLSLEKHGCVVVLEKHWNAALAALKSYEYGNGSAELAKEVGEALSGVLIAGRNEHSSGIV